LDDLERRAALFRKLEGFHINYALFSRSGFSDTLLALAASRKVLLFEGLNRVGG
jgi:hypothetical protein